MDEESGGALVDKVLDKAQQKGTGKWTSQNAMDVGAPIPTINSAVTGRIISALKEERVAASAILPGPDSQPFTGDRQELIDATPGRTVRKQDQRLCAGDGAVAAG